MEILNRSDEYICERPGMGELLALSISMEQRGMVAWCLNDDDK